MILTVFLALIVTACYTLFKRRSKSLDTFLDLDGPKCQSLLLGSLRGFIGVGVGKEPLDWISTYGTTLRVDGALARPMLVTIDRSALSYVLRKADIFPKQKPLRRQLARYLDNGIVTAEGEAHRRQRKMLQSSFTAGMIKEYHTIFTETAGQLRENLFKELEDGEAKVDMLKNVMAWSMDVIGHTGFAHDMGGLRGRKDDLASAFEASVLNFGRISPMWVVQSMVPFFDYIPNPVTYRMRANRAETRRISKNLFNERRRDVLEERDHLKGRKDMLSNLLRQNLSQDINQEDRLPDGEVVAQIGTLLLAGKANTAFAATWLLWELARNPKVQGRLRKELAAAQGDSESLANLPYLNAVMRESLRLHPSVPQTMRVATEDTVIPLDKAVRGKSGKMIDQVLVRKGTAVVIPIIYANRSIELWGPTALEFDPERFMGDRLESEGSAGLWGNILTFIDGPRGCIGYKFALAEIRALLYALVPAFSFDVAEDIESWYAIKNQPIVRGKADLGMQLPLLLKPIH